MKIQFKFGVHKVIGIAIGLENNQSKDNYVTADWELNLLVLCFLFTWNLTYKY
jgi:hypothetical protein